MKKKKNTIIGLLLAAACMAGLAAVPVMATETGQTGGTEAEQASDTGEQTAAEENELKKSSYSLLDQFFKTDWEFQTKSLLSNEEVFCNYDNHVKENMLLSKNEQAKSHFNLAKNEWENNKKKYKMKVYYDDYKGRDYVTVVAIKEEFEFEIRFCFSYNRETKEPAFMLFANKIKGKCVCLWEWRATSRKSIPIP